MKFLISFLFMAFSLSGEMKRYVMDNNYFSLNYPSDMKIERNKENDKSGIYKVVFVGSDKKTTITVKYYSPKSGKDYKKFIENQSGSDTQTERYEKPKQITIGNKKATEIVRYFKEFEDIASKSSSYWLKERLIVIPAKKGFYAITFSCIEGDFEKNSKIFDDVLKSFKTKY